MRQLLHLAGTLTHWRADQDRAAAAGLASLDRVDGMPGTNYKHLSQDEAFEAASAALAAAFGEGAVDSAWHPCSTSDGVPWHEILLSGAPCTQPGAAQASAELALDTVPHGEGSGVA